MVRLWELFLHDRCDEFCQVLANANLGAGRLEGSRLKSRRSSGVDQKGKKATKDAKKVVLNRSDVNGKDALGRTLLHLIASSISPQAVTFAESLLQVPFIDLYVQDLESGWTSLHRALYHGHVGIAQAILHADSRAGCHSPNARELIKIKDREGNTPFELYNLTIGPRDLRFSTVPTLGTGYDSDGSSIDNETSDAPKANLGEQVLVFGSNKNLNLGLGDEDDRKHPEQIVLRRPTQLLRRLAGQLQHQVPAVVCYSRIIIQDVIMSKFHTAVITTDPESNVYMCGYGSGGRLGTGDEATRFNYVCLEGALSRRRVVAMALGQDHSIAICDGDVFTWGSNRFGQLGYDSTVSPKSKDVPKQLSPRQLFGSIKRENIVGAAASSIHSVLVTSSAAYTLGKNEGQLGLMDADARSLKCQTTPRRVGTSIIQTSIQMVSAIDRATAFLLENHEVLVFTHYGWTKVTFPVEVLGHSFKPSVYHEGFISKITGAGNTLCALSSLGEIYTIDIGQMPTPANKQSTTNPTRARNALPPTVKVWRLGKTHMAAKDVAVGQDGSISLCSVSGSVWRREKRVKAKESALARHRNHKFIRVSSIHHAVGVRSNAFGSHAAICRDTDLMREQICVDPPSIWDTLFSMLSLQKLLPRDADVDVDHSKLRFWTPKRTFVGPANIKTIILDAEDLPACIQNSGISSESLEDSGLDMWVASTTSDLRLPVHSFLFKARSSVLRKSVSELTKSYYFSIGNILSLEYGTDGHVCLKLHEVDLLTVLNLVLYAYTENMADVWHYCQKRPPMANRYRQVRVELMKIAASLEMKSLERAVRVMIEPDRCLQTDMEAALVDPNLFRNADVLIELADGCLPGHRALLSRRSLFFEGLFGGQSQGRWLGSREDGGIVRVDLKHVTQPTFKLVLRHLYADTGEELFESVVSSDLDGFIDIIIDVMAVANELMLDRLAQICQKALGPHINTRNVCHILNAVAPCAVDQFKCAALEYICLNLEVMLEFGLLDELDDELLPELDEVVQDNQKAWLPGRTGDFPSQAMIEQYPDLLSKIEAGKQRLVDSVRLHSRTLSDDIWPQPRVEAHEHPERPLAEQAVANEADKTTGNAADEVDANDTAEMFEMDDIATGQHQRAFGGTSPFHSPVQHDEHTLDTARLDDGEMGFLPNDPLSNSINDGPPISIQPRVPNQVWQTSPATSRTSFKEIMAATNISQGTPISVDKMKRDLHVARTRPKISQKERKKMQSQQLLSPPAAATPSKSQSVPDSKSALSSPWSIISHEKASSPLANSTSPHHLRTPMTVRQTISGSNPHTKPHQPSFQSPNSPPTTPQIQIRSIRHTTPPPLPQSNPTKHSMSYILLEQHTQQSALQEATGPHSMQDIQQEQEFQSWWDSESLRVQQAERDRARNALRSRGGSRGRTGRAGARGVGKERGSGRGRGKAGRTAGSPLQTADVDAVTGTAGDLNAAETGSGTDPLGRAQGSSRAARGGPNRGRARAGRGPHTRITSQAKHEDVT